MQSELNKLAVLEQTLNDVILGKADVIRKTVVGLVCRGHLLFEDIPGTGKTVLAKCIARAFDASFKRIQFTPDLLPSDVTGGNVFNQRTGEFQFFPGPVFANILLADEINRATPRTQSALLEAMEEGQSTVDGATYPLQDVFLVLATQNPIEQQGTFPLPEAQLDRFFMRLSLGYPPAEAELAVLDIQAARHPLAAVTPVMTLDELRALQAAVESVAVQASVKDYLMAIVHRTRAHDAVELGVSTRGAMALRRAAQGRALVERRGFVTPDDVKQLAVEVCAHRLILKPKAAVAGMTAAQVMYGILSELPVPVEHDIPAGG